MLKLIIFLQIGISSIAIVFPAKMWCRWKESVAMNESFIYLLTFEMVLLPVCDNTIRVVRLCSGGIKS
jgi:hypothetical protein